MSGSRITVHTPPRWAVTSGAVIVLTSTALACGLNFPMSLLDDRGATLRSLPVDSFAFEAEHLMPTPSPRLSDVHREEGQGSSDIAAEEKTLTAPELIVVRTMRAQSSGLQAYAVGDGLAQPVRDYVAGAVAFGRRDLMQAATFFRHVSPPSRPSDSVRAVWASYMLGRTLAAANDAPGAAQAFARTRSLVADGASDPLGLAVASFGEEARLALNASGLPMAPAASAPVPSMARLGELHRAVALYAQQAAYGAQGGISSLRMVAEALLSAEPAAAPWLGQAVSDPLLRHLLIAYALASANDYWPRSSSAETQMLSLIERLARAAAKASFDDVDTGRLAALAYVNGRYDAAARFAGIAHGPLAAWVRAKLSLQTGDLAATARAYDEAIRSLQTTPQPMAAETMARLQAEPGVVALARGDVEQAMEILYPRAADYWADVAYVAERLLTTEQLRRFIDDHVATVAIRPRHGPSDFDTSDFEPARALRDLLARRLVREGRLRSAADMFTALDLQQQVTAYGQALHRAHAAFWQSDRARAAWQAALIAREDGMDLSGTELHPDMQVLGGATDPGLAPAEPSVTKPLTTSRERRLYAQSSPHPDQRFHYRYVAVEHAVLAAAELPPRSQAYAAVLCRAAGWMVESNDVAATRALYRRYVSHGALVPFAARFGRACPEPDFVAASSLRWRLPARHLRRSIEHHWGSALGGLTILLGMGIALRALSVWRHRA